MLYGFSCFMHECQFMIVILIDWIKIINIDNYVAKFKSDLKKLI
jgi:hypothetical protein